MAENRENQKESEGLEFPASPYEIEFLLHYYYSGEDIDNLDSTAGKEAKDKFQKLGLIRLNQSSDIKVWEGTEALDVYVKALLKVPFPVQKWVMP